jgi:hypothetical protein
MAHSTPEGVQLLAPDFADRLSLVGAVALGAMGPGVQVGVIVVMDEWLRTEWASDAAAANLNGAQLHHSDRRGATRGDEESIISDNLLLESRWPRLTLAATRTGMRSMLCFRVRPSSRLQLILSCYSPDARSFDEHAASLGWLLTEWASGELSDLHPARPQLTAGTLLATERLDPPGPPGVVTDAADPARPLGPLPAWSWCASGG